MVSQEFHTFYNRWRAKANHYHGGDIRAAFDRFFTLFVIYNRLYAEVTFQLARDGHLNLATRKSFPDSNAAKKYVCQYLGGANLTQLLEANPACARAIQAVIVLLDGPLNGHQFAIKLNMVDGSPQRDEDLELLWKFRSRSPNERAAAVLEFLYAVRCNLFHGHKGFDPVQIEVMKPANTLLSRIIEILFERLNRH
jgi:hypothetical protein